MTAAAPVRAYIGLGGNLGNIAATLTQALKAIETIPRTTLQRWSRFYRTPAWGKTDQPPFLNAAAELRTCLSARALLDELLAIEQQFGRVREPSDKWGPRALDLDILAFDELVSDEPGLHLPHPHLHERAFALVPLAEIAPDLVVPNRGKIRDLLATVDSSAVEALD